MNNELLALVINGATKVTAELIRYRTIKPPKPVTSLITPAIVSDEPIPALHKQTLSENNSFRKPTTAETVSQLEGRLIRQLLRLQEDLLEGARINGIPCDCILKHTNEMDITTEELQTMAQKPAYQKIRDWAQAHQWGPEVVAEHPPEFFVGLVPDLRELRKAITESAEPTKTVPAPTPSAPSVPPEITNIARKVAAGEMTRETAIAQIKEMAVASGSS